MSNFYTDYDLPIITVRTNFFPRKTGSFFRQYKNLPYNSVDKTARLATCCLRDTKIAPLTHRSTLQSITLINDKEMSVDRKLREKQHILNRRNR